MSLGSFLFGRNPMRTIRVTHRPDWWGPKGEFLFWEERDDEDRRSMKVWKPASAKERKAAEKFFDEASAQGWTWDGWGDAELEVPESAAISDGAPDFAMAALPAVPANGDPLLNAIRDMKGNLILAIESINGGVVYTGEGISRIDLSFSSITDAGISALANQTLLTILSLPAGLTDTSFVHLRNMTRLEQLTIGDVRILGNGLTHLEKLTNLDRFTLHPSIANGMLDHLPALPSMTHLCLFATRLSADDFTFISRQRSLTILTLNGCKEFDRRLDRLQLADLAELSLNGVGITDESLQHLTGLPALSELDLSVTRITDYGVSQMPVQPNLSLIILKATQVTNAVFDHLVRHPALLYINADQTGVTIEGVQRWQQLRPGGQVSAKNPNAKLAPKAKPESLELIERPEVRRAASVADSWNRIEAWLDENAPDIRKILRRPMAEEALRQFETTIGRSLPEDVIRSYLIHDGQDWWIEEDEYLPGVIFGMRLMPLLEGEGVEWCWKYRIADAPERFQEDNPNACHRYTCYPPKTIRNADARPGWVPLYWDSGFSFLGIDLDPGPQGVAGQVIPFSTERGPWGENRFVLATSWGHFLEDIADELEAGHAVIAPQEVETNWFYLKGAKDRRFWNAFSAWSRAKLPKSFHGT